MATVFNDPEVTPTPSMITGALGPASQAWQSLIDGLAKDGVSADWRYYRDGGWLIKAVKGTKTVAWMQVNHGFGRVTCYFASRLFTSLVGSAELTPRLRHSIAAPAVTDKSLAVTVEVRAQDDVIDATGLIHCKQRLK
jgi:hypothetical protein